MSTSTCPGPATGSGRSPYSSTSGPPVFLKNDAFILVPRDLLLEPELRGARAVLGDPEATLHPVGVHLEGVRSVAKAREHAVSVGGVVELGMVRKENRRAGLLRLRREVPLRLDVGLEVLDAGTGQVGLEDERGAAGIDDVQAAAAIEDREREGDRSRGMTRR